MKLYNFQLQTIKEWITLIPTIEVCMNCPIYYEESSVFLTLNISIFIWHFKWIFTIDQLTYKDFISKIFSTKKRKKTDKERT